MKFLVLGSLEVVERETRVPLGSAKQRLLLAGLLVHANAVVSVDRLADILWGDDPPVDATATLQNYVSRVRAALEPGRVSGDPGTRLLTRAPGYMIRVDPEEVDAGRFERLVVEGQRRVAEGDTAVAAALLDEALGLWRGRAFAEFADHDFARTEALRLEELRRLAVDERVEAKLSLGRHRELIGELDGIVAADPLRERPRAQLMLALYRCGREVEALRTYQQYRRYLGDELGIEPSPALRDLEEAIILQKSELNWVPEPASGDDSESAPIIASRSAGTAGMFVNDPDRYTRRWDAGGSDPVMPKTRYARSSDGVHIAYQVAGDGPLDLVLVHGLISHLQVAWEAPEYAHFFRRLAGFARVICFDKRGTGMSDPVPVHALPTLEQRMDDVGAVLDAVGSEQAAVVGVSEGGQMAALFAATYPERTRALVLYGTYARIRSDPDYPPGVSDDLLEAFVAEIEAHWGEITEPLAAFAVSATRDERFRDWLGRYSQNSASPGAAVTLLRMNNEIDVRSALPAIRVPALVLHRVDDPLIGVDHGRYLAEHIPGAKYVELPGDDHLFFTGDVDRLVDEVEHFLTGVRRVSEPDRVLATLLFTEIVDPAGRAVELGDRRRADLLDRHDDILRRELERFRGREVTAPVGGSLAAFDGPARAVECALAATEAARRLGLELRAGVHTGECEQHGADLGGMAVHLAARVAALAQPGEVLVSRTVTELVVGSRLEFTDRGEHDVDGVPGRWQLFAVRAA